MQFSVAISAVAHLSLSSFCRDACVAFLALFFFFAFGFSISFMRLVGAVWP